MNLYSLKDVVADEYGPVFEAKNDDVAIRVCKQIPQKSPDIVLSDFELYRIGDFDHEKGYFSTEKQAVLVVKNIFEVLKEVVK